MAEILFSFDVCVCVCMCVCACACVAALNAIAQKTVKATVATDFKFDVHVPRDSPDMNPYFFRKGSVARIM